MTAPTIRPAMFADIPQIALLMRTAFDEAGLSRFGRIEDDRLKQMLESAIGAHGQITEGGTFFMVAHNGVLLDGVFLGLLQRFYFVTDFLEATDLIFYARKTANQRSAAGLMRAWLDWLDGMKGGPVKVVRQADSSLTPRGRAGALFRRKGFEPVGTIYGKELKP